MRLEGRRLLRALVLLLWAGFFSYLWLSGASTKFIGPRTSWVVPFGALFLGLTAACQVVTIRRAAASKVGAESSEVKLGDALGMLLLITPMLVLVAVPDAGLGSLAASRKTSGEGIAGLTSILPPEDPDHEISFADIDWASESEEYAVKVGISEGLEMDLEGFVTGTGEGTFSLTRFYVACCAADAVPYSVTVESPDHYDDDTWLRVSGRLGRAGDEYVLIPDVIEPIDEPKDPYLY
ncbi:MAG: TIGR03943 family protein [Actinomycetota bacterium]